MKIREVTSSFVGDKFSMLSYSNLKSSRALRISVIVVIFLTLFHTLNTNWEPIQRAIEQAVPEKSIPTEETLIIEEEYTSSSTIAHITDKVWHTAKTEHLNDDQRDWITSWTDKNPNFRHELLTDASSRAYVRAHFDATRPDIVEVYESLSIPILRADLFRYLMVMAEGGIWSDLDVSCDKEVSEWVPPEYRNQDIDMIVGLEFDFEWRGPNTQVASQFCNWVFAAKKSSRNLHIIVDSVINKINSIAKDNGVSVAGLTLEMLPIDVVDVTGPKIMTIAILESLGQLTHTTVDDRNFSGIKHPKLIGDVLIMPGVAFAATQNHNPTDQGPVLVTHHYEGSWKQADQAAKDSKKEKEQQARAEAEAAQQAGQRSGSRRSRPVWRTSDDD